MRKLLFSILLATTAAAPAIAQPADRDDERIEAREERGSDRPQVKRDRAARSEARRARAETHERVESAQQQPQVEQRNQPVRVRSSNGDGRLSGERLRQARQARDIAVEQDRQVRQQRVATDRRDPRQSVREGDRGPDVVRNSGGFSQIRERLRPPAGARPDRQAPAPNVRNTRPSPQWQGSWRHDRRYDWRRWRDHNRSSFRLGMYFDPFGWNYRRHGIGWRMWPSYYGRSHWLNDPWMYRLPQAPWPYQWVRYYDDALLVNTISGRIVDVEYNFFW